MIVFTVRYIYIGKSDNKLYNGSETDIKRRSHI